MSGEQLGGSRRDATAGAVLPSGLRARLESAHQAGAAIEVRLEPPEWVARIEHGERVCLGRAPIADFADALAEALDDWEAPCPR